MALVLWSRFAGSSPGGAERAPPARSWPALLSPRPAGAHGSTLLGPPDARPCLLFPPPPTRLLTCVPPLSFF
ncbi:unnamed protein product [Gulo gulo]|uniref:Uncharacterized protein n=1 Tax=Gulo gulo TaxID=48420 RepID=A0A9X9LFM8_GULGU|nr:unnamed protein product [Gulo gulo]